MDQAPDILSTSNAISQEWDRSLSRVRAKEAQNSFLYIDTLTITVKVKL